MIPSTTGSAAVPVTTGNLLFHVIVDDFNRTFSMDGPGGPNGIRLHYEMMRVARTQAKILRDFDVRAESREAALAEMKAQFPDYIFLVLGPPPRQNESSKLTSGAEVRKHPQKAGYIQFSLSRRRWPLIRSLTMHCRRDGANKRRRD